jgi:Ca-activated chloride channel family protein
VNFAEPRLLLLLLLAPAAAGLAAWAWRSRLRAQAEWAAIGLWRRLGASDPRRRTALAVASLAVAVLCTAIGLARPRWGERTETVERQGVDIVFVLDSSLSMAAPDVSPSRLFAAKALVRRLVEDLPGNRVALVQAEGEGVVMTPLTVDAAVIDLLLDTVAPNSLPTPGTVLGAPLEQALQLFPPGGKKHRAIILVSDGEDQGGGLEAATDKLREAGVTVDAIGVGTPQGSPIPLADEPNSFKRDRDGRVVVSRLGEKVLEGLARATGGVYVRATSAAADVSPVVARVRAMEKRSLDAQSLSTLEERFQWPLLAAVAALALLLVVRPFPPFGGGA